jgi:hypothetical protein
MLTHRKKVRSVSFLANRLHTSPFIASRRPLKVRIWLSNSNYLTFIYGQFLKNKNLKNQALDNK